MSNNELVGEGSAEDAVVSMEPAVVSTPEDELKFAEHVVDMTQKKVQKQRDHLAAAEEALKTAAAARDALKKGKV